MDDSTRTLIQATALCQTLIETLGTVNDEVVEPSSFAALRELCERLETEVEARSG
jgi:hypothetical protein